MIQFTTIVGAHLETTWANFIATIHHRLGIPPNGCDCKALNSGFGAFVYFAWLALSAGLGAMDKTCTKTIDGFAILYHMRW